MIQITLPYPPSVNRYLKRFSNGHVTLSQAARDFKTEVGWTCLAAGINPILAECKVTIHLYRPSRRGDIDNPVKCLLDALQGHAYTNDRDITEIHIYRHDDKSNPRVEIEIERADPYAREGRNLPVIGKRTKNPTRADGDGKKGR